MVVKKFALYFGVEARIVPIHEEGHYSMEPREAVKYVDENTICVVAIFGSTFTGHFDDVAGLSSELDRIQREKGCAFAHSRMVTKIRRSF